jgi:hypothetical protein
MDFKKLVKFKVMSQLKPRKRNITESGHILIKRSTYDKLIEYGATGRYAVNSEVMEYLNLEEKRYHGPNKYTYLKKEKFQIRVSSEKIVRYLNQNLQKKEIRSGYFVFWYRFIRFEN